MHPSIRKVTADKIWLTLSESSVANLKASPPRQMKNEDLARAVLKKEAAKRQEKQDQKQSMRKTFYDFRNIKRLSDIVKDTAEKYPLNAQEEAERQKRHATDRLVQHFRDNLSSFLQYRDQKGAPKGRKTGTGPEVKPPGEEEDSNWQKIELNLILSDDEGNQHIVSKRVKPKKIADKFINHYAPVYDQNRANYAEMFENMTRDYQRFVEILRRKEFTIRVPKHLRPRLQDFNDYYQFIENPEEEKEWDFLERLGDSQIIEQVITQEEALRKEDEFAPNPEDIDRLEAEGDFEADIANAGQFDQEFVNTNFEKQAENAEDIHIPLEKLVNEDAESPPGDKKDGGPVDNATPARTVRIDAASPRKNQESQPNSEQRRNSLLQSPGEEDELMKEIERQSDMNMKLIDKLLKAPNIFEVDLDSRRGPGLTNVKPPDLNFEREEDKKVYTTIVNWLNKIEFDLKQEQRFLMMLEKRVMMTQPMEYNKYGYEDESDDLESDEDS
eukprot:TRINITY_DN5464_c0_g3_i3.p1 TRINITY_DN5464_c0_g3~~TRINITY_DN5464_c0_g3_i3.p1  ORF type:complete len:499 (-),score=130.96 TRINITY_DN5464_c0_g3_i3:136-1632(-)